MQHLLGVAPMVNTDFNVLGVVMARGGSVGLAGKHLRELHGRTVIDYTLDHATAAESVTRVVVSSDCPNILDLARRRMFETIHRPESLATSAASVQDVLLHALDSVESRSSFRAHAVAILYGNVPVRPDGCIDAAVEKLRDSGSDSVRTWCPVGKWHPYWMATLDGDRVVPNFTGSIHRRQDLPPMRLHDGGCVVIKREALLAGRGTSDPHAMFGTDRRGIETGEGDVVEVDSERDLWIAEAALRGKVRPNMRRAA
ncbi:MAG: acylneuraminate cytidylyltransferase family protein [Planctomycetota bacterium]